VGIIDRFKRSRDASRHARAERRYRSEVDAWGNHAALLATRYSQAVNPDLLAQGSSGFAPRSGEAALGSWSGVDLIAPKQTRVSNWTSVSYQATSKTRIRTGGGTSTVVEDSAVVDRGTLAISNQRMVLMGSRRTIEWEFRRLIGGEHIGSNQTLIFISGRQKTYGVRYAYFYSDDIRFALELGIEMFSGSADQFAGRLRRELDAWLNSPPVPPQGVQVDPRVLKLNAHSAPQTTSMESPSVAQAISEMKALTESIKELAKSSRKVVGFSRTSPAEVSYGALILKSASIEVSEKSGIDSGASATAQGRSCLEDDTISSWFPLVIGDVDWIADALDEVYGSDLVVCISDDESLDSLGIDRADAQEDPGPVIGYCATPVDAVRDLLISGDGIWFSLSGDDPRSRLRSLRAAAALAPTGGLVTAGLFIDTNSLELDAAMTRELLDDASGFDSIVLVGSPDLFSAVGVEAIDIPAAELPSVETGEPVASEDLRPISVAIAGRASSDAANAIATYIRDRGRTITQFDFRAGSFERITIELIRTTRLVNSRISNDEAEWFVEAGSRIDWSTVPIDSVLRDADPTVAEGLYDLANQTYSLLSDNAPSRVSMGKISKVLYLMRPGLFPILDSHLQMTYRKAATEAATAVRAVRPEVKFKRMSWAAIRNDLIANAQALIDLRDALRQSDDPLVVTAAGRLTDLRLLDILSWDPAATGEE